MIYWLTLLAFAADRFSKWWVTSYLAPNESMQIQELLTLRLTYNRGMVFGLLQGTGSWMGWFSLLIVGGLFIYLLRLPKSGRLARAGLALVVGGALGNLVDRLLYGEVLDFITMPVVPWVFNGADIFINGGMLIFFLGSLFIHPDTEETAPDNTSSP